MRKTLQLSRTQEDLHRQEAALTAEIQTTMMTQLLTIYFRRTGKIKVVFGRRRFAFQNQKNVPRTPCFGYSSIKDDIIEIEDDDYRYGRMDLMSDNGSRSVGDCSVNDSIDFYYSEQR